MMSIFVIQATPPWCVSIESRGCKRLTHTLSIFKLSFAENPETRQKAYEAHENRLAINAPILDGILNLRRRIAELLEYPTWTDYAMEFNMAKDVAEVREVRAFLKIFDASADAQCPT